jgi:hypothetical protein
MSDVQKISLNLLFAKYLDKKDISKDVFKKLKIHDYDKLEDLSEKFSSSIQYILNEESNTHTKKFDKESKINEYLNEIDKLDETIKNCKKNDKLNDKNSNYLDNIYLERDVILKKLENIVLNFEPPDWNILSSKILSKIKKLITQ